MAFADFLTEGAEIPQGSALKATTSQTILPEWYTGYATDMLAAQKALSAQPYQTYQGPRIAGFNNEQVQGFDMAKTAAGAYQPGMTAALGAATGALGQNALPTAQPYFNNASGMSATGAMQPYMGDAASALRSGVSTNALAATMPYFGQAGQMASGATGAASPFVDQMRTLTSAALGIGGGGGFGSAEQTARDAMNIDVVGAAKPYLDQAAGINGGTVAQPHFNQAGALATQGTEGRGLASAQPTLAQAAGINSGATAQPHFSQATGFAAQGTQGGGLTAASPYLSAASGAANDVGAYMDPYQQQVVDRVGDLGARTLSEKLLPEIEGRYIASGQFGSSGQMTDTARALRDVNADVLAQQSALMSEGYKTAQQTKLADLARYGQLGATAGQLGTARDDALLKAAGISSEVGSALGGLDQARQNALGQIGGTMGQLGDAADKNLLAAAGVQQNIGAAAGGLEADRAKTLAGIGATSGDLAAKKIDAGLTLANIQSQSAQSGAQTAMQQQRNLLDAASNYGNLGVNMGNLGLNAAKTVGDVGSSIGDIALGQGNLGVNAGQAMGSLAGIAGNAAGADAGRQIDIGRNVGDIAGSDINRQINGASTVGNLAGLMQQYGLTGANAFQGIGQQGQAQDQKNLDLAYSDYLRQQGYPQEQINQMLATFKGVSTGIPTASQEYGIVPTGQTGDYKPSTASTIASTLAGFGGLLTGIKGS